MNHPDLTQWRPDLTQWRRLAVPTIILCLGIFLFGRFFVADELVEANNHIRMLEQDLLLARDQLARENVRATVAGHEANVVRQANELLRQSERERQDEIAALQADLAFYRRLGGANGSQAPLAVHYLELQATNSPRVFRIIFTLTQNLRWAAVISGRVELGVDGILDGTAQTINEDSLLAESAEPLKFRFKYFQQIERLVTLPEGFVPNRLSIRLKSASLRSPVEQSMDWEGLFNSVTDQAPALESQGPEPEQD